MTQALTVVLLHNHRMTNRLICETIKEQIIMPSLMNRISIKSYQNDLMEIEFKMMEIIDKEFLRDKTIYDLIIKAS
jgi:hypothetical protein